METGRLETFSDGVFAIAITLLVLDINVPPAESGALTNALLDQWPSYVAYVISFLTIGIMWVNHHGLFQHIARGDRVLLLLNILLLMCVAFVPWPTALLAEHVGGEGALAATLVYGLVVTLTGGFFLVLWLYVSSGGRLLYPNADPVETRGITVSYLPGVPLYAAATLLAFISPWISFTLYGALAVFYALSASWWGQSRAAV